MKNLVCAVTIIFSGAAFASQYECEVFENGSSIVSVEIPALTGNAHLVEFDFSRLTSDIYGRCESHVGSNETFYCAIVDEGSPKHALATAEVVAGSPELSISYRGIDATGTLKCTFKK